MEITTILLLLVISSSTYANYTTKVNPVNDWGQWEGWGTSLAWWANTFGEREDFADILFTTKNVNYLGKSIPGLGMNIARYNVGGCSWNSINKETMVASSKIPKFKQIEGFWLNWDSTDPNSSSWKWDVDKKQREMMQKAKARGANKFELFSNSPMWWMLINHNPSGADNGGDNLQSWNYDKFAIYLATVAKYASDHWDIDFASVEAFNEASSNWWKSGGTQEGCHISSEVQQKVIEHLRPELDKRGLHNTIISASDENSYDLAITVWNSYSSASKSKVGRVNVHGYQYNGGKRDHLYKIVHDDKKALWNSEYGEGDSNGMPLAENLSLDLYWLHPTAWVYWQPFDYGGWGLIQVRFEKF
jgi:galactan endo-1,6-beta-galactosidase